MKKLSVIIPFAGNDPERTRNLEECLEAIFSQNYKNYEVILVEQTLNGAFYQHDRGGRIKHITISDPQNRGFNLSWCRNVGAKEATGDTLILMDSDFVFIMNILTELLFLKVNLLQGQKHIIGVTQKNPQENG